jgi:phage terminase large subunit-like protein
VMATAPTDWRSWPPEQKEALHARLKERLKARAWRKQARPAQIPPPIWNTILLRGGRGSGKTWAGAHILAEMIRESKQPGEWAVIAPTYRDARDTCIEGEAGLLAAFGTTRGEVESKRSTVVDIWNRSLGELRLFDGSVVFLDGADDGAYRIQGKNLSGAWCDEIGLWRRWKDAWDESLAYATRKGKAQIVATGTPKRNMPARKLVRRLLNDPAVVSRRLRTRDNMENLSPAILAIIEKTEGTVLGRQELEGELLEDVEGALWRREWIDMHRVDAPPATEYRATAVALDPADGTEDGAEQAICVAGLALDNDYYIAVSEGHRDLTQVQWITRALGLCQAYSATLVVEANHGGQALIALIEMVMGQTGVRVPLRKVVASTGKATRAEPVAALYEGGAVRTNGRVRHIGEFPELEEQMTTWIPVEQRAQGAGRSASPDRCDALVWAMRHLMGYGAPPGYGGAEPAGVVPYTDGGSGVVQWS